MSTQITILDGGMGHELKLRGISDGTFLAGVLANVRCDADDDANVVESIHRDYLAAGCDVITTNNFVAVPQRMIECGLASDEVSSNDRSSQIIRAAVDRARAAVSKYNNKTEDGNVMKKLIAGCVPPLTECYFANKVATSVTDMIPEYKVILSTLLECKVDILLAETLSTEREAIAILRLLSGINQQTMPPIWMSFTIHDDKPSKLRSGESLEEACRSIIQEAKSLQLPIEAVGINCSTPSAISKAVPILATLAKGTNIKVCAYGNCFKTTTSEWINSLEESSESAGATEVKMESCNKDYDEDGYLVPDAYARYAIEWVQAGATIIGGCCGSRPKHMKQVVTAIIQIQI